MIKVNEIPKEEVKTPPDYLCPISQDIMADSVTTCDGHTYDRANIYRWLVTQNKNTSPVTGLELVNKTLIPNLLAKKLIDAFKTNSAVVISRDDCLCPITKKIMVNPVLLADGVTYEGAAATDWLFTQNKDTSPTNNITLVNKDVIPNLFAKKIIMSFLENLQLINQEFLEAIKKGSMPDVKHLLDLGGEVDATDNDGYSALHFAIFRGDRAIAEILLAKKPPRTFKIMQDRTGATSDRDLYLSGLDNNGHFLHIATRKGDVEIIKFLLANRDNKEILINDLTTSNDIAKWLIPYASSSTPLQVAVYDGNEHLIKLLISYGANVNCSPDYSPLGIAAKEGHITIAEILLNYGADIELQSDSKTPYDLAVINGKLEMVKFLLNRGSNPHKETVLLDAVESDSLAMVDFLVKKGG